MAQATTNATVRSAAAGSAQNGQDVTHLSLWDRSSGGNFLRRTALTNNPDPLATGERVEIQAGDITITYTAGSSETEASARRAAAGAVAGGVWVQFHTGDPGSAGTSNVIGLARVQITQGQFTIT